MGIKYPWMIVVCMVALAMVIMAWWVMRRRVHKGTEKRAKVLANTQRVEDLPEYKRARARYRMMLVLVMVVLLPILMTMLLLVARFSSISVESPEVYNRDIMLCLDASGSMYDENVRVLEKFKEIAAGLVEERVGLTFFDSSAVTIFPLTDDYDYIQEQLDYAVRAFNGEVDDGWRFIGDGTMMSDGSSKVGEGLASCVLSFDRLGEERSRSIVLATDNFSYGDSMVSFMQAAEMAKSYDMRVYGLNPSDWSSGEGDYSFTPESVEEYRQAVALTGGAYYKFDDVSAVPGLVDQIMKQEAARLEGAPMMVKKDDPLALFIIASAATAGLLVLLWRLRI